MSATNTIADESPDTETASDDYARRFKGPAGAYLLAEQARAVRAALAGWPGGEVLDVGGGHGQLLPVLEELGGLVTVLGSSRASLERVERNYPGRRTLAGDLLALPFADRSFDLVVAVRLVSHVSSWPRFIAEMCRVARHAILIDYPRISGFNALAPLMFPVKRRLEGNTRTYRSFRDAELDAVLAEAGFRPSRREAQFLLPMVLHRVLPGPVGAAAHGVERLARALALTNAVGSPVILKADRLGSV